MTDYQEFLNKLQKRGSHPYRVKHCLGSRDAFHWVRKNKWQALGGRRCDKQLYSQIITEMHRELVSLLFEGHSIEFPYQMGHLVLNCTPAWVGCIDGEYKSNYKVDWKKTLQYLYEDREALNEHRRVKRVTPYIYHVRYYKRKARYHNMRFYSFRVNRSLMKLKGTAQEEGRIHAEQTEY